MRRLASKCNRFDHFGDDFEVLQKSPRRPQIVQVKKTDFVVPSPCSVVSSLKIPENEDNLWLRYRRSLRRCSEIKYAISRFQRPHRRDDNWLDIVGDECFASETGRDADDSGIRRPSLDETGIILHV